MDCPIVKILWMYWKTQKNNHNMPKESKHWLLTAFAQWKCFLCSLWTEFCCIFIYVKSFSHLLLIKMILCHKKKIFEIVLLQSIITVFNNKIRKAFYICFKFLNIYVFVLFVFKSFTFINKNRIHLNFYKLFKNNSCVV